MLIVMAGLPGTGKSTLAGRLADALPAVVLSKDVVRAALFPPPVLDYSPAQDEIAMTAIYHAAELILRTNPRQHVILDGRTFRKRGQWAPVQKLVAVVNVPLAVLECVCSDDIACQRIAEDARIGTHLAKNRTPWLYFQVQAEAVPLAVPRLTLDTGILPLEDCVRQAMAYVQSMG
ncbi:MAG: ATP-binding protein [Gemmataceae bacterium]|nr:ATP-binding protein [Gemmata sp.]MDW8197351.1 ATP-binding protein [Gemmataceae bacterium]